MSDTGVFARLASTLTMDDRKGLLEKLSAQPGNSDQPLYNDGGGADSGGGSGDLKNNYAALPWYSRLFFWLVGLFRGKAPMQVFMDRQVAHLGQRIEEQSPGIYNYERGQLLPEFHRLATELKESARFFYEALDMSVNRDKGAFYVFLASLEMEDVHRRLLEDTDPRAMAERNPGASESALRQMGLQAMEDGIAAIGEDRRVAMYYNARTLNCLRELSSFLFDRLLVSFTPQTKVCSAHLVNNYLRTLNNILYSLKDAPPMTLLESLFIFILQDQAGTPGFDMEAEMAALLSRAQRALAVIRGFNRTVPLNRILRCAERDMGIMPAAIGGGEDWFSLYKEYWRHAVEERFNAYRRRRRRRELQEEFRSFFKGAIPQALSDAGSGSDVEEALPVGIPVKGAFCLSFLRSFHAAAFVPELNLVLRPILIDGDFSKQETLDDFTDAYERISRIDEGIRRFERDISGEGELGRRYAAARMDLSSLSVKRHKIQLVEDEADDEARRIIDQAGAAIRLMAQLLGGLLDNSPDGKFGALANFADLAGKTDAFADGVENAITKLNQALELMDKINAMEAGH